MLEFGIVLFTVGVVMATRWQACGRPVLGMSGVLSAAIGMRVVALLVSGYLSSFPAGLLQAEETAAEAKSDKVVAEVEHDSEPAAKSESATATAAAAGKSNESNESKGTTETLAEAPDQADASVTSQSVSTRPAVPIVTNVRYLAEKRPSWIEAPPKMEGDKHIVAVRAGPYRTLRDCQPDLAREIQLATEQFINDYLNAPHAATLMRYSLKDLRQRNIVADQFSEQLETSLGVMSQVHAQLVFDDAFRDELDQRWSEIKSKSRLAQTGLGAGIVLLFLGTLFSFLKIDTATKGYYTGRLQIVAAGTILALVAASVLLAKWIPWM